jgi:hypothetical protein
MGRIIPTTRTEQLDFFLQHQSLWLEHAEALGIPQSQLDKLDVRVEAAGEKREAADQARIASRSATQEWHAAAAQLMEVGSAVVAHIKARAELTGNPGLYSLAGLPLPNPPSPAGPPEDATDVTGRLQSNGSILLTWKGSLRAGQFFSVMRKLDHESTWTWIGSVKAKNFTDRNLPAGAAAVSYRVIAHRGELSSPGSSPEVVYLSSQEISRDPHRLAA